MKPDKNYLAFISYLNQEIIDSSYQAARLVYREQLLLYYKTEKMLSEKVNAQKWGGKVLNAIKLVKHYSIGMLCQPNSIM